MAAGANLECVALFGSALPVNSTPIILTSIFFAW